MQPKVVPGTGGSPFPLESVALELSFVSFCFFSSGVFPQLPLRLASWTPSVPAARPRLKEGIPRSPAQLPTLTSQALGLPPPPRPQKPEEHTHPSSPPLCLPTCLGTEPQITLPALRAEALSVVLTGCGGRSCKETRGRCWQVEREAVVPWGNHRGPPHWDPLPCCSPHLPRWLGQGGTRRLAGHARVLPGCAWSRRAQCSYHRGSQVLPCWRTMRDSASRVHHYPEPLIRSVIRSSCPGLI